MKQDVINRLKLEQDELLTKLHLAIVENDEPRATEIKAELSTIHDTFVALGHYPSGQMMEKVAVEA